MSNAGWYPDPGGQQGMFRYWDGSAWSPQLTSDPSSPAPGATLGGSGGFASQPVGGGLGGSQSPYGGSQSPYGGSQSPYGAGQQYALPPEQGKGGRSGLWIVLAVVALLVVGVLVLTQVFRGAGGGGGGRGGGKGGDEPTQNVCPKPKAPTQQPTHPNDGRVHGGRISYPQLGSPWSAPTPDPRLPFGVDAINQIVEVEPNYAPGSNWVASILVAELNAGDGFYAAEEGAGIVAKCVLGTFYGDNQVDREDVSSKAITVDGHNAWQLEMHLSFDIKNLKEKGETAIIIVVDTGDIAAALYYASIPDSRPELLQTARGLIPQLEIGE